MIFVYVMFKNLICNDPFILIDACIPILIGSSTSMQRHLLQQRRKGLPLGELMYPMAWSLIKNDLLTPLKRWNMVACIDFSVFFFFLKNVIAYTCPVWPGGRKEEGREG